MQAVGASIAGKESVSVVRVKAPPLAAGEAATGWTRLWTSAVAAGLSEAATMPIDFAKVRLQLQSRAIGSGSAAAGVHYAGMADCIGRTVRAEGPGALFRGIGPALARQCGYTGLSFFLYEPILSRISPNGARTSLSASCSPAGVRPCAPALTCCRNSSAGRDAGFTNRLLAGGAAGGMGISVLNPMEVVKTQLQAAGDTKTSAPDIIKRILRTDGVLGFWAGARCKPVRKRGASMALIQSLAYTVLTCWKKQALGPTSPAPSWCALRSLEPTTRSKPRWCRKICSKTDPKPTCAPARPLGLRQPPFPRPWM
jgi:hypothetical protein